MKRKRKITRLTAVLLTLAIIFSVLPENFVWARPKKETVANTTDAATEEPATEGTLAEGTQSREFSGDIPDTDQKKTEEPYILSEIREKRDANTKHFLMSDKSIMAAAYDQPVHTLIDGKYEDIDNSWMSGPDEDLESSVLENKTNALKVRFAEKTNKNKLATIEYEGYKISWSMPDAAKVTAKTTSGSGKEPIKGGSGTGSGNESSTEGTTEAATQESTTQTATKEPVTESGSKESVTQTDSKGGYLLLHQIRPERSGHDCEEWIQ